MRREMMKDMILEKIFDLAVLPAELFAAVIKAGYGASHWKLRREIENVQSWREVGPTPKARRNFQNVLYKLKRDGLIRKSREGWIATKLGKARLKAAKNKPNQEYKYTRDSSLTMVIFDIPEKYKSKRQWIREALRAMDFKMVQKSVWSGNTILPQEFIEDLKLLQLVDHVDIFKVVKYGSLN